MSLPFPLPVPLCRASSPCGQPSSRFFRKLALLIRILILLQHCENDVRRPLSRECAGSAQWATRAAWRLRSFGRIISPEVSRYSLSCPSRSVRSVTATILKRLSLGIMRILRTRNTMLKLFPDPCVCQIIPPRSSHSASCCSRPTFFLGASPRYGWRGTVGTRNDLPGLPVHLLEYREVSYEVEKVCRPQHSSDQNLLTL